MGVGTFQQPDFETQSGTVYKTAIDGAFAALSRIGAAFAPHEQGTPNMTVRVDAGAVLVNSVLTEIAAQNTGTITAPTGSDHRIDRVVIDATTGTASVVTGTPGALPRTAPAIPSGKLPVCQIALAHDMTVITNDLITDERVIGGGGAELEVGRLYQNLGIDPATELGYGTWQSLGVLSRTPFYPPAHSDTYVKATSYYNSSYYPYFATDPGLSLIGASEAKAWLANGASSQRFHIDLGAAYLINSIYYENYHASGGGTNAGAKNFTFWGSNTGSGVFDDLVYGNDDGWTQIGGALQFNQHVAADQIDPKYIPVSNNIFYRYYAIKIADDWGGPTYLGLRRIVLQIALTVWLRSA